MVQLIIWLTAALTFAIYPSLFTDTQPTTKENISEKTVAPYPFKSSVPSFNYTVMTYVQSTFELSQLTGDIRFITDESAIYSDIQRLNQISKELYRLYSGEASPLSYEPVGELTKIQSMYQETMHRLHTLTPMIPTLLNDKASKTEYYINYIATIKTQIKGTIKEAVAIKHQLNQGNSPMPFDPQTPQQLSFALENQMHASIMSMFQSSEQPSDSGMPYSSIATPANTDMFNQNTPQGFQSMPSANASPLQMMSVMPMF